MAALLQGILFRRSIRASYASCDLVIVSNNDEESDEKSEEEHVVVLIQFTDKIHSDSTTNNNVASASIEDDNHTMTNIRSYTRRFLQLGHTLQFYDGQWLPPDNNYKSNPSVGKKGDNGIHLKNGTTQRIRRFEIIMPSSSNSSGHFIGVFGNDTDNSEENINHNVIINMNPIRTWNVHQCQEARCRYYPKWDMNPEHLRPHNKIKNIDNSDNIKSNNGDIASRGASMKQRKQKACQGQTGHGGGIGKRQQGQVIADFLIELFISQMEHDYKYKNKDNNVEISNIPTFLAKSQDRNDNDGKCYDNHDDSSYEKKILAIHDLSQGSGVLDIAGGSGHVSMALSLKGITSTVIDPRSNVGKLPGRDRKIYKRALRKEYHPSASGSTNNVNHPKKNITPVPFSTFRAWFGNKPNGVDLEFRQQDNNNSEKNEIPIICQPCSPSNSSGKSKNDSIVRDASAIVALHPDEATEAIVDVCVKYQKPFVIVPCCVFSRLFPFRLKPLKKGSSFATKREYVTTYEDFIDYLCAKHSSIQKTLLLNFDGANLALWSTFS